MVMANGTVRFSEENVPDPNDLVKTALKFLRFIRMAESDLYMALLSIVLLLLYRS